MKRCTWCGKEYPDEAKVCALDQRPLARSDGTVITEPEPEPDPEPVGPRVARRRTPEKDMITGGIWCAGGLLITIATYTAASGGGTYIVAWGAILFGGLQFIRGLMGQLNKNREVISQDGTLHDAQSLLNVAARLESIDRAQAIAKYREVVDLFPETSASAEAERNIQILRKSEFSRN